MDEQAPSRTEEDFFTAGLQELSAWWERTKPLGLLREHLPHYAKPYATALYWAQELSTKEVCEAHRALVRRALEREGVKAPTSEEVEYWAKELPAELGAIVSGLGLEEVSAQELYEPTLEEGIFALDARAAEALELRGVLDLAQVIRAESSKRITSYQEALPIASPLGRALGTPALWWLFANDKLAQEGLPPFPLAIFVARAILQQKREKDPIPTPTKQEPAPKESEVKSQPLSKEKETVAAIAEPIANAYSWFSSQGEITLSSDQKQVLRNGELLAEVATIKKRDFVQLQKGLHLWGQLTFRRAVNYLVRECWKRHQDGETRPDILEFNGPLHFAECIGEAQNRLTDEILKVLVLGQSFSLSWPGGIIGGLWTFQYQRPARGRPAWLQIKAATVLEPHYGMGQFESPWRVPVVQLPPFVGRRNDHAAQAALAERLLIEMVERRLDIFHLGGAKMPMKTLSRIADEVGVTTNLSAVLERWESNGEDGEAFLERKGDLLNLAITKPYRAARHFIYEAGRRAIAGKEAAKKGIQLHQRRLKTTKGLPPPPDQR
jgi:hypothetical protein